MILTSPPAAPLLVLGHNKVLEMPEHRRCKRLVVILFFY